MKNALQILWLPVGLLAVGLIAVAALCEGLGHALLGLARGCDHLETLLCEHMRRYE